MTATITSGWHIVLCEPNRELHAVAGMTDRGFEGCCPCVYGRRKTGKRDAGGRPVLSLEPTPRAMIPGYAFVKLYGDAPDYDGVKAVPGVRNFYRIATNNPLKPRYAGLKDSEIADLRTADELDFERFQRSVMPRDPKRLPSVEFERGKIVRFVTQFGNEIYGAMQQKNGGGMVKIISDSMSYIVPHAELMEMEGAL